MTLRVLELLGLFLILQKINNEKNNYFSRINRFRSGFL
jgi:hypothetical protein